MSGLSVKVNAKNQVTIPKSIREKLKIKVGDHIIVSFQENTMILSPKPASYTSYLQGLHPEIWKDVDTEKYLNDEHDAW